MRATGGVDRPRHRGHHAPGAVHDDRDPVTAAGAPPRREGPLVAVLGDAHAHAEALEAVLAAAAHHGAGPDLVAGRHGGRRARSRARGRAHARALRRGAAGQPRLRRDRQHRAVALRCARVARRCARSSSRASTLGTRRSRGCGPAGPPRGAATCSAGTAARATPSTSTWARPTRPRASACRRRRSAWWRTRTSPRPGGRSRAGCGRCGSCPVSRSTLSGGRWLLNPGAVGAPMPSRAPWYDALEEQAAAGAYWLLLDLERRTATWHRAPFDPGPARERARALGLDAWLAGRSPRRRSGRSAPPREHHQRHGGALLAAVAHRDEHEAKARNEPVASRASRRQARRRLPGAGRQSRGARDVDEHDARTKARRAAPRRTRRPRRAAGRRASKSSTRRNRPTRPANWSPAARCWRSPSARARRTRWPRPAAGRRPSASGGRRGRRGESSASSKPSTSTKNGSRRRPRRSGRCSDARAAPNRPLDGGVIARRRP